MASLVCGILLGRGPFSGREPHRLFIYPDRSNHEKWVECGDFESADGAREAVRGWLRIFPDADYEIGVGKPRILDGQKVYKEIVK